MIQNDDVYCTNLSSVRSWTLILTAALYQSVSSRCAQPYTYLAVVGVGPRLALRHLEHRLDHLFGVLGAAQLHRVAN